MYSNLLEDIYIQICAFRKNGVKMKDLAEHVELPPSMFSAIYSTVLPTYIQSLNTLSSEDALDYAISQVNNVSKNRLLANVEFIHDRLNSFSPKLTNGTDGFINSLNRFAKHLDNTVNSYIGTYLAYSLSSRRDALKVEPFLFTLGEQNQITTTRKNHANAMSYGTAIISNGHSMYVMMNESHDNQLALVNIYLQLPFLECPKLLRGLYVALDLNRNPIARRIVFIKQTSNDDLCLFKKMEGKIILKENLSEEEKPYYNYTCEEFDYIKMCAIPNPQFDEKDLIIEKKILSL